MSKTLKKKAAVIAVPVIIVALTIFFALELFSGEANGQSAKKVSAPTIQEAQAAIQQVAPGVTVLSIEASPVEGLWEVVVDTPQGKRIAYIDSESKYLIAGSITELATKTDLTRQRFSEINKVDFASIPLDDAVIMGNPKAAKKVVVFDDPD